jgi:hypothetical protein
MPKICFVGHTIQKHLIVVLFIYGCRTLYWALDAFSVSWSFTQLVGLLGRGISLSQGRYQHRGQNKHRINVHRHPCLIGIRTHDPSVWAGEDSSCVRPLAHCDQLHVVHISKIVTNVPFASLKVEALIVNHMNIVLTCTRISRAVFQHKMKQ